MTKFISRKISRREFVLSVTAMGAVGGFGYTKYFEPENLEVTTKEVSIGLGKRIRLLQLSDFHLSEEVSLSYLKHAIEMGLETKPDIICLTGDYVTNRFLPVDEGEYVELFKSIALIAPTYGIFGNHDGGNWVNQFGGFQTLSEVREILEKGNVKCLYNESLEINLNGVTFNLLGVGDEWAGEIDVKKAFLNVNPNLRTIVLCHNPDSKNRFADFSWELMLCGHTHGGQLVVPFTHATPFAPVMDHNYVEGLKPWQGRQIHITRGLGNVHGVRFNCRPEASVLEIT